MRSHCYQRSLHPRSGKNNSTCKTQKILPWGSWSRKVWCSFPSSYLVRSLRRTTNPLTFFENLLVSPTENQRVWFRLISALENKAKGTNLHTQSYLYTPDLNKLQTGSELLGSPFRVPCLNWTWMLNLSDRSSRGPTTMWKAPEQWVWRKPQTSTSFFSRLHFNWLPVALGMRSKCWLQHM